MKTKNRFYISPVLFLLLLCTCFIEVSAQAIQEPIGRTVPISKDSYKSWSLFVIANQDWIIPEGNEKLKELYDRFHAFGNAIGPEHLAVWFWLDEPGDSIYTDIDVLRGSMFCSKLKLPPSKSPYIIMSTEYPGEALLSDVPNTFFQLENYYVIELNGLDAVEITQLLSELADKILLEDFENIDSNSDEYWRSWQHSFELLRDTILGFSQKIKISINTTFFNVEIEP